MKKTTFLSAALLFAPLLASAQVCNIRFEKDTLDVGSIRAGETAQAVARIINMGTENTELLSVKFTEDVFKADVPRQLLRRASRVKFRSLLLHHRILITTAWHFSV